MARPRSHRTALVLYAVLLVLPSVAFGSLLWRQLADERRVQLTGVPQATQDAARRLERTIRDEVLSILAPEQARDVYDYQRDRWAQGHSRMDVYVDTPLVGSPLPTGILGWFQVDRIEIGQPRPDIQVFLGAPEVRREGDPPPYERFARRQEMIQQIREDMLPVIADRDIDDLLSFAWLIEAGNSRDALFQDLQRISIPFDVMAMNLHASRRSMADRGCCVSCMIEASELLGNVAPIEAGVTPMRLVVSAEQDAPLFFGFRRFMVPALSGSRELYASFPEHLHVLLSRQYQVQGVVLDAEYVFDLLPQRIAQRVLPEGFVAVRQSEAEPFRGEDWETAELDFLSDTDVEVVDTFERSLSRFVVATNVARLERTYRVQNLWFFSVAALMIVSLALGLQLLLSSLRQSQEQAQRTENFVAAVTHELRTPIAAVRMYGEMLRDGWVESRERQDEYLQRIVKETHRLSSLVDRVIDKRRLNAAPPRPEPTDLNRELLTQRRDLGLEDEPDVRFELAEDLPPVMATSVGVHAVLQNLVENAQKYAPVRRDVDDPEPILVRTRLEAGRVVLEVLDRGPGIPDAEKGRIFDVFYRTGSEQTRSTQGTGLGLHLVDQYARVMKAQVRIEDREGGGAIFRITFRTARRAGGLA